MNVTIKNLPESQAELTISVSPEEQQPHLVRAAEKISETNKIPGFRPGHAPYDVVAAQVGDMKILDTALEAIVRESYVNAVKTHNLKTVGMPEVSIEKLAPKNEIVYRAVVSLIPEVVLPDFEKISITRKGVEVVDAEIDEVLKDVKRMHAVETEIETPAGEHDKVTVDMELLDGAVPLEGGQAKDHMVYLDEPYYVPGFTAKLLGAKKGDALEFVLPFPKEHFQKLFAGKDITFKVAVKKVAQRALPELDDELAKKVGSESIAALKDIIRKNISDEHTRKADEAAEIEMMKTVIAQSKIGDIPKTLLDAERRRIAHDLQHSLQQHGISVEQYLADLKKNPEELEASFTEQAIERVKMSLVTFALAGAEKIDVSEAELQEELEAIRASYKNNTEATKNLLKPEVQESILNSMRNRKVVDWMREKMIK